VAVPVPSLGEKGWATLIIDPMTQGRQIVNNCGLLTMMEK